MKNTQAKQTALPHVVIVGGGFGGLYVAKDARKNNILIWLNEIVPLTVEGIFV
jgi:NADH:ubiquinone reductase (H+-translocating)